ncbi:MAG: hypothetical protein U5K77_01680 [Candidatus Saccharibacteria bacterium]|nr:hypothetical protein [Candidatus Saccharibacteria bacterium]
MSAKILQKLLEETYKSPIFGDSFDSESMAKMDDIKHQIATISSGFSNELQQFIAQGVPEFSAKEVADLVGQIAPKTVGFCPALVAGELDDTTRLQAISVAIGLMYWGDQTMDRGDDIMSYAVQLLAGQDIPVPKDIADKVQARLASLKNIETKIDELALPEDYPFVLACFSEQVLLNEVYVRNLSEDYQGAVDKQAFMDEHGKRLAQLITVDAGFPSVSSSLYAIYRQHDSSLPSLQEVYDDPIMVELIQICNVVVRIADELGDWDTDAGHNPEYGVFTLNPFNQPNEAFLRTLFELAGIQDKNTLDKLHEAFMHFHDGNEIRKQYGDFISDTFFSHVRSHIHNLPPETTETFYQYIVLCKRVLEIGYVNQLGDVALAGE